MPWRNNAPPPDPPESIEGWWADDIDGLHQGAKVLRYIGHSRPGAWDSWFHHTTGWPSPEENPQADPEALPVYQLESPDGVIFERMWCDILVRKPEVPRTRGRFRPAGTDPESAPAKQSNMYTNAVDMSPRGDG